MRADTPITRDARARFYAAVTRMDQDLASTMDAVDAVLGGDGTLTPMPRLEEVLDFDDAAEGLPQAVPQVRTYPVITGEYAGYMTWGRHDVEVGTPIAKPTPVFTKLDPSIVEEELERYASR